MLIVQRALSVIVCHDGRKKSRGGGGKVSGKKYKLAYFK